MIEGVETIPPDATCTPPPLLFGFYADVLARGVYTIDVLLYTMQYKMALLEGCGKAR